MFNYRIKCENKPIIVKIGVALQKPAKVFIRVFNPEKMHTVYIDRWQDVNKTGEFDVRLPQNCDNVILQVGCDDSNDDNLRLTKLQKKPIEQFIPCLTGGYKIKSFVKFAQEFAENAGELSVGTYFSDDNQFRIDYLPTIQDGGRFPTPARIHNQTGRMEISRQAFLDYTVPMRMAIMLHEFAHFNMNREQKNEIEADLNALKIYMGLGYPVIEAHKSFLHVFKESPTEQNKERYEYIKHFIDNFEKNKYTLCLP